MFENTTLNLKEKKSQRKQNAVSTNIFDSRSISVGEAKLLKAYTNKEKVLGGDERKEQTQTQNES